MMARVAANRRPVSVSSLIAVCTVIEATLLAADFGLVGIPRLRELAYQYGGFWVGLLGTWQPNYPSQPYLMFGTYAFLHGGPLHLLVNMLTLYSLGRL
jgi:membrane associated rhomboid family serine protease